MRLKRLSSARSATIQKLAKLAKHLSSVSYKVEDGHWEQLLKTEIDQLLQSNKDSALMNALDELWQNDLKAYELLADFIENRIQTQQIELEPNYLFIAIPVLTWSRNQLPLGETPSSVIKALKTSLHTYCLSKNVDITLSHTLYSPDSLPQGFAQTAKLAKKHFEAAKQSLDLPFDRKYRLDADANYLADSRFWLGAIRAPVGETIFKWQTDETHAQTLLNQWSTAAHEHTADMFLGSSHIVLPPAEYFSACRSAESDIRAFSVQAAVLMIESSLDVGSELIIAVIGACWTSGFEEYRISFLLKNEDEVLQGVSWPLLAHEEDEHSLLNDIQLLLTELKIGKIIVLDDKLSLEYCDDCGTPLFPDPYADMVHPGMPNEDEHDHTQLIVH